MYKTNAETTVRSFMRDGYFLTAHTLSKMTGYSAQHINRVLKKLYFQGVVCYTLLPHQGKAGFARKWCSLPARHEHRDYQFEVPEYTQEELPL